MPARQSVATAALAPRVDKAFMEQINCPQEYAGDPTSNVTPRHIHDLCWDTTNNALYWAHGTAAANWKKLSP